MKYVQLSNEALIFSSAADRHIYNNGLPHSWFDEGYDHIAVKAYSPQDYEDLIEEYAQFSEFIAEAYMDDRYIAVARLIGKHGLSMPNAVSKAESDVVHDVELMLARPDDQTGAQPKLDHAEIYMPRGLISVSSVLVKREIDAHSEHDDSHAWISTVISPNGYELKYSNKRLSDIIDQQVEDGTVSIIHGEYKCPGEGEA